MRLEMLLAFVAGMAFVLFFQILSPTDGPKEGDNGR